MKMNEGLFLGECLEYSPTEDTSDTLLMKMIGRITEREGFKQFLKITSAEEGKANKQNDSYSSIKKSSSIFSSSSFALSSLS